MTHQVSLRSILILFFHLRLCISNYSSKWPIQFRVSVKYFVYISHLWHEWHTLHPSHSQWSDHPNEIYFRLRIMWPLILQMYSCYLLTRRPKYCQIFLNKLNFVTCRPIARQRLGKHIHAGGNARDNRTSIAGQRRSKHASPTIAAVCGPCRGVIEGYRQKTRPSRVV
jgi:hypothetical protein